MITSKVLTARTGSKAVRTAIPESIVADLDIKAGDTLIWKASIMKKGKHAIVVRMR